ncbi:hypothetical protein L0Y34_01740 [Candidatus Parcubacteria bacterium]|nr:hypothetical protein [Candidatus Parcubacteria bacterium]
MSHGTVLAALGILVVLSPFAGLPYSYLTFVLVGLGLLISLVAIFAHLKRRQRPVHEESSP